MEAAHKSNLFREIAGSVQLLQRQIIDGEAMVGQLTQSAVKSVPGAHDAGITVADRAGTIQTVAAIGRYPELLDKIQQRHREGPCLSAAWEQRMIRIDDVALEQRWPAFCFAVAEETPIRSIMSFRLFADRHSMGALNFYAEKSRAFDDDAAEVGLIFATHTALAWKLVRREEQFRSALASRDIIGQAKGMLMERFKIDAGRAFELLKRLSQNSNTPVAVVARRLVESERRS
ncbi:MAG TPA: GAF and ANTAR domain-containing protein [Mycobacterium sp.]|uniref:GAF and ANTAR domain-containing protein n=1 Tax=Mycobacterium sp. TaxID=1785 RepID=UPI002F4207AC